MVSHTQRDVNHLHSILEESKFFVYPLRKQKRKRILNGYFVVCIWPEHTEYNEYVNKKENMV